MGKLSGKINKRRSNKKKPIKPELDKTQTQEIM
jgi:hypothetical protein